MKNSARVYLSFQGDFNPEEITEYVGIKPTYSMAQGARFPERRIPIRSIWEFSSEEAKGEVINIGEISANLVKNIAPSSKLIIEAIEKWELVSCLQFVLKVSKNSSESSPIFKIDTSVISFLSDIKTGIDVDIFYY